MRYSHIPDNGQTGGNAQPLPPGENHGDETTKPMNDEPGDAAEKTTAESDMPVAETKPQVSAVDGRRVYKINTQPSQALVIHCGDPRFQKAFRDFVTEELGIGNYTPVVIGGGVHAFGTQSLLPKNFKVLWEQVKFFVKEGELRQVIIINHEDCRWYHKMKGLHPKVRLPLKGKLDLETAARTILRDFGGVSVRSFWAALDGDNIVFTETTEESRPVT